MIKDNLIFRKHPGVEIATNTFINVPIILQYGDTPLIEVVKKLKAGYTTRIPIYHEDGTYLAKAVGSRLVLTEDGRKANLALKYSDKVTACELNGRTLFEIIRKDAASLKTEAELHTPDGCFVKCANEDLPKLFRGGGELVMVNKNAQIVMSGSTFVGCRIGIHFRKDGGIAIAVS